MQFTPQQQKVIDLRNKNILVSAAAGSGKTAVLVERIIQKVIIDKIDIDKILKFCFAKFFHQPGFADLTGSSYHQMFAVLRYFPFGKLSDCCSFHIFNSPFYVLNIASLCIFLNEIMPL